MTDPDVGDTLARLGKFVVGLRYQDLPTDVVDRETDHVLDTLGCILYGSTTPWVRKVTRAMDRLGESGAASLLGTDAAASPARAALVNGTASHAMDYDDHCQEAGVHAGSATVPAALAYAEATNRTVDGREFLTAIVAGVEAGIRSGFGIGYGSVARGWHIAGWTGAFAAAATASKLYGLDRHRTAHALAVAGTQGCGLLGAQYGADVKRFHMGKAAEAGYLAAALAREDFTGDAHIFGDRYGAIGPTMSDEYDTDAVTATIGDRYRLLDKLSLKPFPSVGQVHAAVDGVAGILGEEGLAPSDVSAVTVQTTETVKDHVGWAYEPTDVMAAQANIQYAVATLLVDGEVTIDAYTDDAIRRPAVLARVDDVAVVVDDAIEATSFGSIVEVTVDDRTYENAVETPRGYPSNPMRQETLRAKFDRQATAAVSDGAADALADSIDSLGDVDDVTDLVELCSPGPAP